MRTAAVPIELPDEPPEAPSLSTQIYDRLRTALMRADLKPDERLKIRDLAASMGTSETPVREAIFQLARDGAVEIKPRHYVRVRRVTLAEYLEIRAIRLNLEPLAAERALPHIRAEDIDELARGASAADRGRAIRRLPRRAAGQFRLPLRALLALLDADSDRRTGGALDAHRAAPERALP